jgi:hypothetical protein
MKVLSGLIEKLKKTTGDLINSISTTLNSFYSRMKDVWSYWSLEKKLASDPSVVAEQKTSFRGGVGHVATIGAIAAGVGTLAGTATTVTLAYKAFKNSRSKLGLVYTYPEKMDPKDLLDNKILLSNAQIEQVEQYFKFNPTTLKLKRTSQNNMQPLGLTYSVIKVIPNNNKFATFLGKYELYVLYTGKETKLLGKGVFGRVKLAQNLHNGEIVAVKIQNINISICGILSILSVDAIYEFLTNELSLSKEEKDLLTKEFIKQFMLDLKEEPKRSLSSIEKRLYKLIVEKIENLYLDCQQDDIKNEEEIQMAVGLYIGSQRRKKDQNQSIIKYYTCSKFIEGKTLIDYLNDTSISIEQKLSAVIATLQAIYDLHSNKQIVHNDLHCNNVIYNPKNDTATIIDFGFSKKLSNLSKSQKIDCISNDL